MTGPGDAIDQRWEAHDGTTLAGTLQLPGRRRDVRSPGVLLLNGSGPLDRDSNTAGQTIDIAKAVADHLAGLGIASLRFDKRGVGTSGGEYLRTGFETECDDAVAAFDHLAALPHVDPERIGVIGHSVGATLAIRLAASKATVAAAVLLAGAASPGELVLEWQSDRIGRTLPGPNWLTGRIFGAMQRRNRAKLADPGTESINASGVPMSGRWFREYAAYDPAEDLRSVACPVLAITGGKDLQVDAGELATIAALVAGPCRTEAPRDLTHVLRSTPGRHTVFQYRSLIADPVDAPLLATVGDWLVDVLA